MQQTVRHAVYGEIVYSESFWTGRKSLTVNGVALNRISKKEFLWQEGIVARVTGNFLVGASLLINGETVSLTPKIKWYEIALCILPFILIMVWGNSRALCEMIPVVGGAIGGGISGLMCFVGFYFVKGVKPIWLKILIALASLAITFGICCGIGYAIVGALS